MADNNGLDPNAPAPAAGELSVPKYRLDEVSDRLRRAEEALRVKDELINQHMRPQTPQAPQINFEELGMDERTGRAFVALAEKIADQKIGAVSKGFQQQLGNIGLRTEENSFLARYPDKAAYIEKINAQRLRHYQTTGGGMDMETAYKLVVFDEMTRTTRPAPAQQPTQPAPQMVQAQPMQPGYQTQMAPSTQPPVQPQPGQVQGAPPAANQEMSLEDMESALNQHMSSNGLNL